MSAMSVSMPAPVARYAHASATTTASPTPTISRSRRSKYSKANSSAIGLTHAWVRSKTEPYMASSRNTVRRLYDVCERAVRAFRVELDRPGRADVGRGHLGGPVLEPFRHHDLDAMWRTGHRVLDRLDL